MKKLIYLPLIALFLSLTSCINVIEELFLKKDGTGTYTITMDMSSIMEGGGIRSLMQMSGEEISDTDNPFSGDEPVEMDTIMHMSDAPDSVRMAFGNDELLNKIKIHQEISEAKEIMKTTFTIDFDKLAEVEEFLNNLDKLQGASDNPMAGGGGGLLPSGNGKLKLFDLTKRTLTRLPGAKADQPELGEEELGMMKMMMADASYKTIYHLPGKVKAATMENAVVDGKTVTIEYSMMDALESKAKMEGLIKFKKR